MDNWQVVENAFDPQQLHFKETLFAIGNGYSGTRGSFEEGYPGEQAVTLIHGLFDDIPIVHSELVNAPNWLHFELLVGGERFRLDRGQVLSYRRVLSLRDGVLTRQVRWRSPAGATLDIHIERFSSLADRHCHCIRFQVTSVNYSGPLEFRAGLFGHVDNLGWVHWELLDQGSPGHQQVFLELRTKTTRIECAAASSLDLSAPREVQYHAWHSPWSPLVVAQTEIRPGERVSAEKIVTLCTARETPQPRASSIELLDRARSVGYEALKAANAAAWEKDWERCNVVIEGDDEADLALRYSLFQLLIAAPRQDERVSIAAKSLSGFGYRGHAFWDTEIFVLPFFTYTLPEVARNLLMYRYHTLPGARRKTAGSGYEGAMFAWESAATGDETTPRWVPDPNSSELIRIWCGDIEHHITADIAYAVLQYWRVAGDDDFMRDYGAEIVLEAARFWGSRAEWNETRGCYEINDVIGPDENHDHVDNNAYTNNMARWNLQAGFEVLGWLDRTSPDKAAGLRSRLDLTPERLAHWQDVIDKMYLGFNPQTGLFEQFEGFYGLAQVDLQDYEPRTTSFQALKGVQEAQKYQVIKQPDVLMWLYLLGAPDRQILKTNYDFYTPRTDLTYGSSLGPAIQASLAAWLGDLQEAYRSFIHAARTDLQDARGNTADGIHAATAGGLWQAAVLGFGGLKITTDGPQAQPQLPPGWQRLAFQVQVHGRPYRFDLRPPTDGRQKEAFAASVQSTSPSLPILGAIFDLDGVLTDTSELHYRAWKRLADEEGFPFNRQENEALRGIPRRESLLLLLKGRELPEERLQGLMERKNRYYVESIESLSAADLLPGARELLEEIRAGGVKVAIGSASKNARAVIEKLGIEPFVDAVADGNSVSRQKPAPDLFLHAAELLGFPPGQCVVFEDAEAGVEAALAGGMWAVGIGPAERVGAAHLVIPGFAGQTWSAILEKLVHPHKLTTNTPPEKGRR